MSNEEYLEQLREDERQNEIDNDSSEYEDDMFSCGDQSDSE